MSDVNIRTTITAESVRRLFGPVDAIDYRAHPGEKKDGDLMTIFNDMRTKEVSPLADLTVLKGTIYSFKNRRIITKWLRDVCVSYRLKSSTLCLAIQLTDAYLRDHLRTLAVDRCQLVAITALWIAAKFEEMDDKLPPLRSIIEVCDGAYTGGEVLDMEEAILGFFRWRLPHVTVLNHLYLQLHSLNTDKLVHRQPLKLSTDGSHITARVLVMDKDLQRVWHGVTLVVTDAIKDCMSVLCAASMMPHLSSASVFQLFGTSFILAQRVNPDAVIKDLPGDECGSLRLFLSTTREQTTSIFVERGSFAILRSINGLFLDLCDVLLQEVVTHVEFLRQAAPIKAFGILGLALCLQPDAEEERNKEVVQYVRSTFGVSATLSLAVADLLCTMYNEALPTMPASPTLVRPTADIRDKLVRSFDRKLPSS